MSANLASAITYDPLNPVVTGNPYPHYAQLREEAPVHWLENMQGFAVSRWDDVLTVLRDGRTYSSGQFWPALLGEYDPVPEEEIFGPVLSVIPYDGEDEAVRIANDSDYGLGGSVWSVDGAHALDIARRVESGTVGVNGYMPSLGAPFGGIKASGLGREFGPEAIGSYQSTKSIYVMG